MSAPHSPVEGPRVRGRAGFSLLEVLVALAILVVSLTILVETQGTAAWMTLEGERVITATDLANAKLTEAILHLEVEGFQQTQVHESGDFSDFTDGALASNLAAELNDYQWEYWISEVDVRLASNIASMAESLQGSGAIPGASTAGAGSAGSMGLGAMGLSSESITEMLTPYIREVRVRVWWGDNSERAEEEGEEVVIVSHVVNPAGVVQLSQELPQ